MTPPILSNSKSGKKMHFTVAALIKRNGKFLLMDRANPPYGIACVAGHVDEGETAEQALPREIKEEAGLSIAQQTLLFEGEIEETCGRGIPFHYWKLYAVSVKGKMKKNSESKSMGWYSVKDIEKLDKEGKVQPVWMQLFRNLKIL